MEVLCPAEGARVKRLGLGGLGGLAGGGRRWRVSGDLSLGETGDP